MKDSPSPLILTLKLDAHTFSFFDRLRQQHFPPERNFLSAHVTLFHHLPHDRETQIRQALQEYCAKTAILPLRFSKLRSLGQGVAAVVESEELIQLRQTLANTWQEHLTRQDQQGYRPHITIQNKVAPDAAQALYKHLANRWKPLEGQGEGLLLWYYQGGPWELVAEFPFLEGPVE